jgi:hypothetical protein
MSDLNRARGDVRDQLNRSMPAAAHAKLGDMLAGIIETVNEQNATLAALKAAVGTDAAAVKIPDDLPKLGEW